MSTECSEQCLASSKHCTRISSYDDQPRKFSVSLGKTGHQKIRCSGTEAPSFLLSTQMLHTRAHTVSTFLLHVLNGALAWKETVLISFLPQSWLTSLLSSQSNCIWTL